MIEIKKIIKNKKYKNRLFQKIINMQKNNECKTKNNTYTMKIKQKSVILVTD